MTTPQKNFRDNLNLIIFLLLLSLISGLLLSLTYSLTKDQIALQQKAEINQALKVLLPQADNYVAVTSTVYVGYRGRQTVGRVILTDVPGYGGPITQLTGINKEGKVTGVKIINLLETPGLGDKAKNPKFLEQFTGKTAQDPLVPKKDIVALTGATITSRAVCKGVKSALKTPVGGR